jgi:pimeloyl-ACP methyl ester carboxylesterase
MAAVIEGYVEVAGARLYYKEKGQGLPALFLHGGGCTSELWGDCFERISQFARAVAYDQRAFGKSTGKPPVGMSQPGDDAIAVVDQLGAAPAVALGHSIGATIALDAAVRYPDRFSALVLLEPPVDFRIRPEPMMLGALAQIQTRRLLRGERAAAEWFFKFITASRSGGPSGFEKLSPELQEVCLANARSQLAAFKYSPEASGRHLPSGGLRHVPCPATCIMGTESRRGLRRTTRHVAKETGARLIEVPGASHFLPGDAGNVIVESVRDALAGSEAPAMSGASGGSQLDRAGA